MSNWGSVMLAVLILSRAVGQARGAGLQGCQWLHQHVLWLESALLT